MPCFAETEGTGPTRSTGTTLGPAAQIAVTHLDLPEAVTCQSLGQLRQQLVGGATNQRHRVLRIAHAPPSLFSPSSLLGQISLQRGRRGMPGRCSRRPILCRSDGAATSSPP